MTKLIYDWNNITDTSYIPPTQVFLLDETLRDGLQSSTVIQPSLEAKVEIIKNMCNLGIHYLDIGFPGASKKSMEDIVFLIKEISKQKLPIKICCAARTHPIDIQAVIDVSQQTGIEVELLTFLGSSLLRGRIEGWSLQKLAQLTTKAVEQGIKAGLPVSFVTEDTTRSNPKTLEYLFKTAINAGSTRLVLCDTVGYSTPPGVAALVRWTRNLTKNVGADIKLDWHGHNDRGFATINSIYAMQAGCDRLHATGLGIGERAGNTAMEQLLVNLKMMNLIDNVLLNLTQYCQQISDCTGVKIPENYPIVGRDVFSTATGVHAAAIVKAIESGRLDLAEKIYSSIPVSLIGRSLQIQIGCMSGKANVIAWLLAHKITPEAKFVERILTAAKSSSSILKDKEIYDLLASI